MTIRESRRQATSFHHGRHDHLISAPPEIVPRGWGLDAIIVPTARSAPAMEHAIDLAAKLNCTLVALCSAGTIPSEVGRLVRQHRAQAIVIDATALPPNTLPCFETSEMLARTWFSRSTDTSQKRNLGLLLARLSGWRRIVFLDDDITIPDHEDLRMAAWLTEEYSGVGIAIDPDEPSFPDNSVVCHAYRDAGGDQGMFIGGGALAVGAESTSSFFPNLYNEDWFFLLGEETLRPVTMTGRALQRPYDPYDRRRAQAEELGDCLAEGLFWLLDAGQTISDADERYWRDSLRRRLEFIAEVTRMVSTTQGEGRKKRTMLGALRAAEERCGCITPTLCSHYVSAWQDDRQRWQRHLENCQAGLEGVTDIEKVLSSLGLAGQSRYLTKGV